MILELLAAAAVSASPAGVDKLGWMAGSWGETKAGVTTRETWLPPLGGAMSGATQTNRPGKPAETEFATITTGPDGRAVFTPYM